MVALAQAQVVALSGSDRYKAAVKSKCAASGEPLCIHPSVYMYQGYAGVVRLDFGYCAERLRRVICGAAAAAVATVMVAHAQSALVVA